jgi:hypothetical protein
LRLASVPLWRACPNCLRSVNRFAYFLNVRPTETFLKLNVMRYNKEFNKNYYIVSPDFQEVKKRDKDILSDLKCALYIYSQNLIKTDCDGKPYTTIIAENYCNEDYINENAFRYFQVSADMPTLKVITQPIEQYDTQLVELPSNPKAVKKAA